MPRTLSRALSEGPQGEPSVASGRHTLWPYRIFAGGSEQNSRGASRRNSPPGRTDAARSLEDIERLPPTSPSTDSGGPGLEQSVPAERESNPRERVIQFSGDTNA